MQILQRRNKGVHLNTIERYHIYAEFTENNHLNDEHTIFPNKIFDVQLKPPQPTTPPPQKKISYPFQGGHTKPTTQTQALPPTQGARQKHSSTNEGATWKTPRDTHYNGEQ